MKLVCVAVLALAATGCAFGTRKVNLLYGDRVTTPVAAQGSRTGVAVAKFSDGRSADVPGKQLGWIRNVYRIPTAPVMALQDPVLWVSDGLARSLESRGYRVNRVDASTPPGSVPIVSGAVTKVSTTMTSIIQADIEATVSIDQGGAGIFSTVCKGSGIAGGSSASDYESLFSTTMDQFIADCVPRLVEPLEDAAER